MNSETNRPRSFLGIPVKILLAVLVFFTIVLTMTSMPDHEQTRQTDPAPVTKTSPAPNKVDKKTITATPGMIEDAIKKMYRERAEKEEREPHVEEITSPESFRYLIELTSGRSIRAEEIAIKPDSVTLFSANGIQTTIPRESVSRIIRVKRPQKVPDETEGR